MKRWHKQLGEKGEQWALDYLEKLGYACVEKNYRYGKWEVDLIVRKGKTFHFVEVKTRAQMNFGHPEQAVTPEKIAHILAVADHFQHTHPAWEEGKQIQVDVLSIFWKEGGTPSITFIEDVYV